MPVSRTLDGQAGRATLHASGEVRLEQILDVLREILVKSSPRRPLSLLADLREMDFRPSPLDLRLFPELGELAPRFEAGIALLACGPRNGGIARVVTAWARGRGLRMESFTEAGEAVRWLSRAGPPPVSGRP